MMMVRALGVQPGHQVQEVPLLPEVQTGGGFVQDDHPGGQRQDPGHRQALALALGQGEGIVAGPVQEMHAGQGLLHPAVDLLGGEAQLPGAQGHLLPNLFGEDLVVGVLEDEAGPGAGGPPDLAGLGLQQAPEELEQGGLAAAVGAQDGGEFALPEREGKVLQDRRRVGIGKGDPAQGQDFGTWGGRPRPPLPISLSPPP